MNRQQLRNILTWVLAVGLMGYLFYTIPLDDLRQSLGQTNLWRLLAVVLFVDVGALLADSWATSKVITWYLAPLSFAELVPVRAATYLMAILNYNLGQAGLVYFIHRAKNVPVVAATALIMMMMGCVLLLLLATSLVGVVARPDPATVRYLPLLLVLAGGALLYLGIIRLRPGILARQGLLRPLFDAGVWGHIKATALRVPHMGIVVTAHFLAMGGFGIDVPLGPGLVFIPIVLLVAALPITPFGLGTMQMAAIELFSPYAVGATPKTREAAVLAYSLSLATLALLFQAVMGLFYLKRVSKLIALPGRTSPSEKSGPTSDNS